MNYKMIGYVISRILWTEGILLLLPLLVSALYREPLTPFLLPMLALGLTGLVLCRKPKQTSLYARDGDRKSVV